MNKLLPLSLMVAVALSSGFAMAEATAPVANQTPLITPAKPAVQKAPETKMVHKAAHQTNHQSKQHKKHHTAAAPAVKPVEKTPTKA